MKHVNGNEVLYHIGLSKNNVEKAEYAILINDKKYVEAIAKFIDPHAEYINENREYFSYLANFNSQKIVVISTGLGGPAMGIGLEEMATVGLKYFVRLGETGALQNYINIGDFILSKGAMRYEATSTHYAPDNYPAVASLEMTNTFEEVLKEQKLTYYTGVTVTTDAFWAAQERKSGYLNYVPIKFQNVLNEWKQLNVLSVDMELATLFTLCNVFGLESVAILDVVNKNFESDDIHKPDDDKRLKNWKAILTHALKKDMKRRGKI
jgi:uridine phosphorylase